MRKDDRHSDIRPLIQEVLEKGYLMTLATHDESGVWACDVIYIFDDDFKLYWISDPKARHSKAIEENPAVAGTITVSGQGDDNLGIQFSGTVQRLKGPNLRLMLQHFKKRKKVVLPKSVKDAITFLEGDMWYECRLTHIELIYEKLFGFEKRKIHL